MAGAGASSDWDRVLAPPISSFLSTRPCSTVDKLGSKILLLDYTSRSGGIIRLPWTPFRYHFLLSFPYTHEHHCVYLNQESRYLHILIIDLETSSELDSKNVLDITDVSRLETLL